MNECMKSIRVRSSVNKGITRRQMLRGAACTIRPVKIGHDLDPGPVVRTQVLA